MNRREILLNAIKFGAAVQLSALPAVKALAQQSDGGPSNGHPVVNDDSQNGDMPSGMDMQTDHLVLVKHAMGPGGVVNPVLTRSGGNLRHGTYLNETRLTPEFVAKNPPKKIWTARFPDDARGIESQPLFVPNVKCPSDGITRSLMLCSTMSNHVYAHDAKAGYVVWSARLGNPILGTKQIDGWAINQYWGVLSTGVVIGDTWYVVAWVSPDGSYANASHWFYSIDITTGQQTHAPLRLTQPGTLARKQRASLTAVGTTVYIPWGTVAETAKGAHGFITAVDTLKWQIVDDLSMTGTGSGAGIWMAGQGLAEYNGTLYTLTGNGDFDGKTNFGECFVCVQLINNKLQVTENWNAFRDTQRSQYWKDEDLGSGGAIIMPDLGLIAGAGKDGILYVLDIETFKPKTLPIFYTYYPGPGVSAQPTNMQDLDKTYNNRSHHMHSTSVYWNNKLYCWGENGNLRVGSIDKSGVWKYLARSSESASVYSPVPPGGMPGAFLALSANGDKDGIIWCSVPDGDANRTVTTGRIFAFDAQNWGPKLADGDTSIKRVWMSDDPPAGHYVFNKFLPPVVNDGMIYMGCYDGTLNAYA